MLYTCGEEGWRAELEPAEYERDCGTDVASNDSVSKCGEDGTFTDSRDGRAYKCAKIGNQIWMAENLDFGEIVRSTENQVKASAAHAQKYCYDDDSTNCAKYGGLYQWHTAMGLCAEYGSMDASSQINAPHRGICPAGWHVPTQDEWETLIEFVQSPDSNNAGRMLKSHAEWDEQPICRFWSEVFGTWCMHQEPGVNGDDAYGWNALPSGFIGNRSYLVPGTGFPANSRTVNVRTFMRTSAEFWTATESGSDQAVRYSISAFADSAWSDVSSKKTNSARSVRCVQN